MAQQCCTGSTRPGERAEGEGLGKKAKGFHHGESALQRTIPKCSVTIDTPGEKHPTKQPNSQRESEMQARYFLFYFPLSFFQRPKPAEEQQ